MVLSDLSLIIIAKFKGTETLSEEVFVDKVIRRMNGFGGINLDSLLQNDVEMEAYKNASFISKVMFMIIGRELRSMMNR